MSNPSDGIKAQDIEETVLEEKNQFPNSVGKIPRS